MEALWHAGDGAGEGIGFPLGGDGGRLTGSPRHDADARGGCVDADIRAPSGSDGPGRGWRARGASEHPGVEFCDEMGKDGGEVQREGPQLPRPQLAPLPQERATPSGPGGSDPARSREMFRLQTSNETA